MALFDVVLLNAKQLRNQRPGRRGCYRKSATTECRRSRDGGILSKDLRGSGASLPGWEFSCIAHDSVVRELYTLCTILLHGCVWCTIHCMSRFQKFKQNEREQRRKEKEHVWKISRIQTHLTPPGSRKVRPSPVERRETRYSFSSKRIFLFRICWFESIEQTTCVCRCWGLYWTWPFQIVQRSGFRMERTWEINSLKTTHIERQSTLALAETIDLA